jgi:hypothetical protein
MKFTSFLFNTASAQGKVPLNFSWQYSISLCNSLSVFPERQSTQAKLDKNNLRIEKDKFRLETE